MKVGTIPAKEVSDMSSKKLTRVCALLLSVLMLLTMMPAAVFADGEAEGGDEPLYRIEVAQTQNGKITLGDSGATVIDVKYFSVVPVIVTPNEGYELSEIYALGVDGITYEVSESGGRYSINGMPKTDLRVYAKFITHDHKKYLEHTAFKAATCEAAGNKEYWYCTGCGSFFLDADATKKTDHASLILQATGHKWGAWKVVKQPTATQAGEKQRVCQNDSSHVEKETIPATGKKAEPAKKQEITPTPTPAPKAKSTKKAVLIAASTVGTNSLTISWNKIKGADRYVIMFSKCNDRAGNYKVKKLKTVKAKVRKYTVKGLENCRCYKYQIIAQKKVNGKYKEITKSTLNHNITGNQTATETAPRGLKLNKNKITLKKNKTYKLKGEISLVYPLKELLDHEPALRYATSDPSVATVSKSGTVKAKGKGKCTIYVQTINGICQKCKVTVK